MVEYYLGDVIHTGVDASAGIPCAALESFSSIPTSRSGPIERIPSLGTTGVNWVAQRGWIGCGRVWWSWLKVVPCPWRREP